MVHIVGNPVLALLLAHGALSQIITPAPFVEVSLSKGSCQQIPEDTNLYCEGYGIKGEVWKWDKVEWNAHESWFAEFVNVMDNMGGIVGMTDECMPFWTATFCEGYFPPCSEDGTQPKRLCRDWCEKALTRCKLPFQTMSNFKYGHLIIDCDTDTIGDKTVESMVYTVFPAEWSGLPTWPSCDKDPVSLRRSRPTTDLGPRHVPPSPPASRLPSCAPRARGMPTPPFHLSPQELVVPKREGVNAA